MLTESKKKVYAYKMRNDKALWGRARSPSVAARMTMLTIFLGAPLVCLWFTVANAKFGGSLQQTVQQITWKDVTVPMEEWFEAAKVVCVWIGFQWSLAQFPDLISKVFSGYVGGWQKGSTTPAGHELWYNVNGLQSWIVTHVLFGIGVTLGFLNPLWVIEKWLALFYVANIVGYTLTFFAYLKAYTFPTYPKDNKVTGYPDYDVIMGVEMNPRMLNIDFKLFFNSIPGICGWTLLNLCFAYYQYQTFGTVTNAMLLVNVLQGLYVLDFFWNQRWYLKTVDICHDHFGFYLAWGDCVWLPFMYTLQGYYLAHHPVVLDENIARLLYFVGVGGYMLFRLANSQKDHFRNQIAQGVVPTICGEKATYLKCRYQTSDGKTRISHLLTSGCWGMARHLNYTGDIILSASWCFLCGFGHILPYFYLFYITLLLVTRVYRDETRMKEKYGEETWKDYCAIVPYRLIPGIY